MESIALNSSPSFSWSPFVILGVVSVEFEEGDGCWLEVFVNALNFELGDVSAEIEEVMVMSANHGNEDGVLISIWCVYLNSCPCLYTNLCMGRRSDYQAPTTTCQVIRINCHHEYEMFPGSENKPMYDVILRLQCNGEMFAYSR